MVRAVIYARCSTEEESQREALAKQVMEAEECVRQQGWHLVDAYVESCSGTSTKGRMQYCRLYEDLSRDCFDIVVIKSQDRLMRNTKEWYLFVDRLLSVQKRLYMYLEQKFYCADDALITGIKAILAEEYSRELSKKINNAHRNRQKRGGAVILTSNTYGYRKKKDKSVEIVEEEAAVKRRMYELCAAGYGCRSISAILQREGVCNRRGKPFSDSSILRMIRNPINKGTVVMNQTHYDFDSKKTVKIPKEEQYIYDKKVPAVVSEKLWADANKAIESRREKRGTVRKERANFSGGDEQEKCLEEYARGRNPGKSFLSGKIICGLCGEPYYRTTRRKYGSGEKMYEWKCKRYLEWGRRQEEKARPRMRKVERGSQEGCDNIHLPEERLLELLRKRSETEDHMNTESMIAEVMEALKIVFGQKDRCLQIERDKKQKEWIESQMSRLLDKLLAGVISDRVYQVRQRELEQKIKEISEKIEKIEGQKETAMDGNRRLSQIEHFLKDNNKDIIKKAMDAARMEAIEKIVVYPEYMELQFSRKKGETGETSCDVGGTSVTSMKKIEYGHLFDYYGQKQEVREKIIELMEKDPCIHAKQIARELDISLSKVNYQIDVLKKEGRIRFQGKGGKGKWQVR
ncbi:MAG: recombinase family protein [Robinsoniella sp.]|nr:recombinase family protein [Robinsoniella sp.]